ncbi:MAG: rod shape-determining protein [Lachnospiraceae bacterium]|nr:rod shape-determining protein [Lachnospiraceae bacterium]
MAETKEQGNLVFGLDIGTRSIVGTVGYREGDVFTVLAQEVMEHETRAMLDGQIHDIAQVGNTITQVKKKLEKKLAVKLTDVCIAAAGRVLETVEVNVNWELDREKVVTPEEVAGLTSMGIEKAYSSFQEKNKTDIHFYCVGNSVIRFYLNGYPIGNLENHKARSIGADMIATFLPDEVVDGLYKSVEIAGLRVVNMTLEPIAAISVAIPEMYRMLNIGLVDVGAGTSDICITKDGCIVAYGMIPCAGDALTEKIAKMCLVDFNTAEAIKRGIETKNSVKYKDIMGLPQSITKEAVLEMISAEIDQMTSLVADKLKELNGGKPVSAVFVVGGGGRIEGYTAKLSEHLGIVAERVAVRGEEVMTRIRFKEKGVKKDSLMVTPIGICLNYYEQSNNFIYVTFNDELIKIYDSGNLAVVDAAMHADFRNDGLFPKRGKAINYTVNGKVAMKRGETGEAARIKLNGEDADMNTPIRANDVITVEESTAGADAKLMIADLPEFRSMLVVRVEGRKILLPRTAVVNGEAKSEFYEIQDGDEIVIRDYVTVREVREFMDVALAEGAKVSVNNEEADDDTAVYENFTISWKAPEKKAVLSDEPEYDSDPGDDGSEDTAAGAAEEVVSAKRESRKKKKTAAVTIPAPAAVPVTVTVNVNGRNVKLTGKPSYVFVDIFDHIDFDLKNVKGSRLVTEVNGQAAEYMQPVKAGDVILVRWEK